MAQLPMSDQLQDYMCNLDGDIVLDSLIPANTSGAFCDLLIATHPTAGKLALKRPRGDCYDESVMKRIEMEASVWKMLRHPRILQFLGIYKIGEDVYLVSPFAENGSLPGFLKARPDVDRKRLVIEIAEGLTYLHQCGIIHGDLKGNNILIAGEEHILLCDFGLAKHVTSRTSTSLRGVGSIPWQSPELLRDTSRRTFSSDVYAFGITVSEVLSGNEPYANHNGIGSIITGVLLSGERPLTEPSTAPDGTSYLQLWEEAGKCWDEDPSLRPSMLSILNRLDHERAEIWVTSQQIALENSLGPPIGSGTMSHLEHIGDGPPRLTDNMQTLHWAKNIQSRLNTFISSRQAISRIPPELLAAIIWRDDSRVNLRGNHPLRLLGLYSPEATRLGSNVSRMFRCVQLRRVSRAWRHAIDTSPQLSSFVWVDSNQNNVEYIQQRNSNGALECVVSGLTPDSSALRPLTHRISHINIVSPVSYAAEVMKVLAFPQLGQVYFVSSTQGILLERGFISPNPSTNVTKLILEQVSFLAFEPKVFAFLRTIKIIGGRAHHTFIADLFAMLSSSLNLTELVMENLNSQHTLTAPPPARVALRKLRRMRLSNIPAPILSSLLLYLDAVNLTTLVALNIDPSHLHDPDSASGKTILSLIRASCTRGGNCQLFLMSAVHTEQTGLTVVWPTATQVQPDRPEMADAVERWDFSHIETSYLSNADALKILRVFFDLGIHVDGVTLDMRLSGRTSGEVSDRSLGLISPEGQSWLDILTHLDTVRTMVIGVNVAETALKYLSAPIPGLVGQAPRYLCPNLTHIDIKSDPFSTWPETPEVFPQYIGRRQAAANTSDGPARLKKIGIPHEWVGQMEGNDSIFDGVEIFSTTDM